MAALRNWAGNITYSTERVHRPTTVDELRQVVAAGTRLRALGSGHSFNRLADTSGALVSAADLPSTVEIDPTARTVTVGAGVRYGDLATRLHHAGYALHNLASLPHISVAGACATATHGSGVHHGNLATAVSALELVAAGGDLVRLSRADDPDQFPGAVVSLGALGIVTRMTLAVEPTFTIRQYVYEDLPRAELVEHWEQVLGAGYSVSLFTTWSGPAVHQVWLKLRDDDPVTPAPWAGPAPERWFGARRAEAPRHPIPGVSAVHCTEQLGRPGPWHERLPHFRLEFTPSAGDELQSEFFVPRHRALEAFAAVESLADQVAPVLQISEIRTVAADDLWLSPAYQCDSLALHFTWIADPTAVAPVLAAVSERLAPLGARPHWGKLLPADPGDLSRLYGRWADFDALVRRYDPAGVFRNPMLTELFGP